MNLVSFVTRSTAPDNVNCDEICTFVTKSTMPDDLNCDESYRICDDLSDNGDI